MRDGEVLVSVRVGTHQPDLRMFRTIPRVGEFVHHPNYENSDQVDTFVVHHVSHWARVTDEQAEDRGYKDALRKDRPVVDIVLREMREEDVA